MLRMIIKLLIHVAILSALIEDLPAQGVDYQLIIDKVYNSSTSLKANSATLINYIVSDGHYDGSLDLHYIYAQATIDGIPIKSAIQSIVTDGQGDLKYSGDAKLSSASVKQLKSKSPQLKSGKAVSYAIKALGLGSDEIKLLKASASSSRFAAKSISEEVITTNLVYVPEKGSYRLCYEVAIFVDEQSTWWEVIIDASDGEYIEKNSWTLECFEADHIHHHHHHEKLDLVTESKGLSTSLCDSSYNVYALPLADPNDGARSIVQRPWAAAPTASPYGWHDTSLTMGNNVIAYDDRADNDAPGILADGGLEYCFDFTIDFNLNPDAYLDAAITNLFYANNMVHDIMYQYGFDEGAGNFQNINPSGEGEGGDRVRAEAQDGSGLNNANFSTPPDGFRPRMQMFNWVTENRSFSINGPSSIAKSVISSGASFGDQGATVMGEVVAVDPRLACSDILNPSALMGKIALIDRGECFYVDKILRAQEAGAIAMIVCQYDSLNTLVNMGGDTSAIINIPGTMISGAECLTIRNVLDTSAVTVTISPPTFRDSDLDNVVIIHEYAHGISTRLTGGASNSSCLNNSEQMGEGWSDWYGLMLTMKASDTPEQPRGVATYLLGEAITGTGIREYPYSTDMTENPAHYFQLPLASAVHDVGQIWASMLWDLTWALIEVHGFDSDMYQGTGGNNIALQLVTTALKLQPCSPGFVDGRDAILAADELLYGGRHACIIWQSFARRGLGYTADQGSSDSRTDGSPSSDMPPFCDQDYTLFKESSHRIVTQEDTVVFTITANGFKNYPGGILDVQDSMAGDIETIPGSLTVGALSEGIIGYMDATFGKNDQRVISYKTILSDEAEVSLMNYEEGFEVSAGGWLTLGDTITWRRVDSLAHEGRYVFYAQGVEGNIDQFLTSPTYSLSQDMLMSFWHSYDIEPSWDGGLVELQVVGDTIWHDLRDHFLNEGYDERLIESSNSLIAGREAFTGNSNGYIQSWIDLSYYTGKDVIIRFHYGSDLFVFGDGWRIDDIVLYDAVSTTNYVRSSYGDTEISDTVRIYQVPSCITCNLSPCEIEVLTVNVADKPVYRALSGVVLNRVVSTGSMSAISAGDSIIVYPTLEVPANSILTMTIEDCIDP